MNHTIYYSSAAVAVQLFFFISIHAAPPPNAGVGEKLYGNVQKYTEYIIANDTSPDNGKKFRMNERVFDHEGRMTEEVNYYKDTVNWRTAYIWNADGTLKESFTHIEGEKNTRIKQYSWDNKKRCTKRTEFTRYESLQEDGDPCVTTWVFSNDNRTITEFTKEAHHEFTQIDTFNERGDCIKSVSVSAESKRTLECKLTYSADGKITGSTDYIDGREYNRYTISYDREGRWIKTEGYDATGSNLTHKCENTWKGKLLAEKTELTTRHNYPITQRYVYAYDGMNNVTETKIFYVAGGKQMLHQTILREYMYRKGKQR